ncbi:MULTISPECIES: DUF3025 domain-containing protein [unclassified Pseudoxanthomonas]|uniref:DUF3025 domain-containing protein n=1 Tax=unclassified Pseudoxanthomonas TaxID=2645906 RepID=UPI0008E057D3|nr:MULTISPECIES: DUF3025 domain-containing protein [unclassified Pseudoxanthomonas]PPJ43779.1 DUF3025 domain-containing protein [Pseudoxanthomonas sp. KAs_5_3]SFV36251.1 Protein of unknown function [Pseudoxanthomonas sp. YR558]
MTGPATGAHAGNGRRRFVAPLRGHVDAACFRHPLFDGYGEYRDLLTAPHWPDIETLNTRMPLSGPRFARQDAGLLADGLHYEARTAQGCIATRADNWHDLFNAMVWLRHPTLKHALNQQQCGHIARMGSRERSPAQQALTQFDESGVIVQVRDATLLDLWDRHDWVALFHANAARWHDGGISIAAVVGHALMEQVLVPGRLLVGKGLVVLGDPADALKHVVESISAGATLTTPSELRPLPLAGIPGWHAGQDAAFYGQQDYFRPLRDGRVYPRPL